ncbi:ABC transporter permease [uncultured Actinomyces sp.]|uniref:ABC transporter permease n=1 Tax=uncultured Actinomyces sp. TaxID=249061 RepID=UPI00288B9C39|nr:ABC transporter permease [uncultured Actinomyces sp.]
MTSPAATAPSPIAAPPPGAPRFSEARLVPDTLVMAWRSLIIMVRNPGEFYDILIQPIMFTVLFGELFGGAIAGDVKAYLPTIVPGLIIMNALTTSQSAGVDLREDMDKGVFDRFRTMPMSRIAPVLGPMVSDVLRYLICTSLTVLTGYVLGYRPENGWSGTVGAIALAAGCAWAIAWIFLLLGTIFSSAQAVTSFTVIVLFPLTFLSNAMVPTSTLPGWLKVFVRNNPVSHIVDGGRYLLDGTTGSAGDVRAAIIGSLLVLAVMAPLTILRYQRRNA